MADLTIFQKDSRATDISGLVGVLCEVAPDSSISRRYPEALTSSELIGDISTVKSAAAVLARKLLAEEPPIRGIRQLSIFEEVVIRELQQAFHVLLLYESLVSHGVKRCCFLEPSAFADSLEAVVEHDDAGLEVKSPARPTALVRGRLSRSWRRLRQAAFAKEQWRSELQEALNTLDPYHRRALMFGSPRSKLPRDAIWFYSTAHTFTNIGLLYEPCFQTQLHFLVENPLTGGRPLDEGSRKYWSPYMFASRESIPDAGEIRNAREAIAAHLAGVRLDGKEARAREILISGPFMRIFYARLLPKGLFFTDLFRNWTTVVRPAALVVGNPGFEGYALHAARSAKVPSVLLQHGILGDYCQYVDPPVDHYVVRGQFWRDFLSPAARRRATILDPSTPAIIHPDTGQHEKRIVFLTTPYQLQPLLHDEDLNDILGAILEVVEKNQARLVVRVHPLEKVAFYERKVAALGLSKRGAAAVTFSQGAGLEEVLTGAKVAVTYCSTAFLDCLRYRVPIVSFDWHDFSFKALIAKHRVFSFARNLSDLKGMIRSALDGTLKPFSANTTQFLAGTPSKQITDALSDMVARKDLRLHATGCSTSEAPDHPGASAVTE